MKALVIYDSAFGNTKKIAEVVAKTLGAKAILVKEFKKSDLDGIDLLVVGSPINGWRPLPSITDFLNSLGDLKNVKATSFDTRVKLFIHGDAKDKIAKTLESAGSKIVVEPMAFYVKGQEGPLIDGEIEKASKWAKTIL